uniref:Uncharacterized protein n=1 Tax=Rhizophora mucronata TaxID=61149 RepID=A0A2P2PFP6_RHIMU
MVICFWIIIPSKVKS